MVSRAYIVQDIDSKHQRHGVFHTMLAAELALDKTRKVHYVLRVETDSTNQFSSFNSQGDLVNSLTNYVSRLHQNDLNQPIFEFAQTHNLKVSGVSPDMKRPFDKTKSIDAEVVGQETLTNAQESRYLSEPVLA